MPPPTPTKEHRNCTDFSSRAEFDAYYGDSFHPEHDGNKDCVPCNKLKWAPQGVLHDAPSSSRPRPAGRRAETDTRCVGFPRRGFVE